MRRVIVAILTLLASTGCSPGGAPAARQITERERDSLISVSGLPGATVVGRALATSDASARRAEGQSETLREIGESERTPEDTP